jgi:hypothetical protein
MIIFYSFAEFYLYGRIISEQIRIEQNVSAAWRSRQGRIVAVIVSRRNEARNNHTQTMLVFVA